MVDKKQYQKGPQNGPLPVADAAIRQQRITDHAGNVACWATLVPGAMQ
jgi:hypothetical protein